MKKFIRLRVQNFGSWKALDIDLNSQGIVCITGLSGAGKSSIWRALHWCLWGNTPDPVGVEEIRHSRKPTIVRLDIVENGERYAIIRYRGHPHYGNKLVFTGSGIPAVVEDSHIKSVQRLVAQFLGINETVFRATTYFSQQNFRQFHVSTDQVKKAFIESLTYGSLFEQCETLMREKVREYERELDRLHGRLEGVRASIAVLTEQTRMRKAMVQSQIQQIESAIETFQETIAQVEQRRQAVSLVREQKRMVDDKLLALREHLSGFESDIKRYRLAGDKCPRCGLVMPESLRKERLQEALGFFEKSQAIGIKLQAQQVALHSSCQQLLECEESIARNRYEIDILQREILVFKQAFRQSGDTQQLRVQQLALEQEVQELTRHISYSSFWLKGFGWVGLRGMVLAKAVGLLHERTRFYLHRILRDRIIFSLKLDKNRLVASCNGRSYWSLSGGERQALDVSTGFALRDLAESYNKCRFNLLILDEPTESQDPYLTSVCQNFFVECAKPSTFLVTHRELSSPFDKVYEVTSNEGVSSLRQMI